MRNHEWRNGVEHVGDKAMRRAIEIVGLGLVIPVGFLVLWTEWNLRHSFASLLLIGVPIAAGYASAKWSLRTGKALTIIVGATALLASRMVLGFVTNEFGVLTWCLTYLLFSISLISGMLLIIAVVRLLFSFGSAVKFGLTVIGGLTAAVLLVAVPAAICDRYMAWYFMLPTARLSVAGRPNSGYVHRASGGSYGTDIVITVRQRWRSESYWIVLPANHRATVSTCKNAPGLPVFGIGDLDRSWSDLDVKPSLTPPERDLVTGPTSVEFTGSDGKRVRVEW